MREVKLKAGKRKKILGLMTRNLSARIEFEVETAGGSPPSGTVETSYAANLLARETTPHPLQAEHVFEKPWRHHGYRIHVTSDSDATVRFRSRHIRDEHIYGVLIALAVIGLLGSAIIAAIRG